VIVGEHGPIFIKAYKIYMVSIVVGYRRLNGLIRSTVKYLSNSMASEIHLIVCIDIEPLRAGYRTTRRACYLGLCLVPTEVATFNDRSQ
jgi:hypothetical protein